MVITLCGDVSITQVNRDLWEQGDIRSVFGRIPELFRASDRVVINLECALTEQDTAIRKFGPNLKGPGLAADILKEAGVTDCGLSNNHIYDFGKPGLEDTLRELERVGLNYTGIGKNEDDSRKDLVITQDDKTVRVITVCEHEYSYAMRDFPGARPYDPYDTAEDIRAAKANADYVIVMYHGGKEHCQYPSPRLRKLCRAMVANGADLVLCQHSHCIGCTEEYRGGTIIYGQGNFHFIYPELARASTWREGLAVRVELTDTANIQLIPVVTTSTGMDLASDERAEQILAEIEARNKALADGTWLDRWHDFCVSMKEQYENSVAGFHKGGELDIELFAHYLDCEAHTDVWRELYPTFHNAKISQ